MAGLDKLFAPKNVAVIGASGDTGKIRGRVLAILNAAGFAGEIFPVNPSHEEVQGLKAYPSIGAVPAKVDLAVIALSAGQVIGALEDCAAAGVGSAIVFASGFAEGGDTAEQDRITAIARRSGMRILGPNTVGYFNEELGIAPTFSPIMTERVKNRRKGPLDYGVDIICQSGGLGFALYSRALASGLPVRNAITTGNEADCEILEIAEYLLNAGGSRAILLFVEGFSRPERLESVARLAAEKSVPLLIAKMGRSDAGQRAAVSHTAHLTGSDVICDAVFERHGVIRVSDPEEMLAMAAALSRLPPAKGNKIAVITTSGGSGGWAADIVSGEGMSVPEPSEELKRQLDEYIPGFGSTANPIDVTANVVEDGGLALSKVVERVARSGEYDAALVIISFAAPGRVANMRPILEPILKEGSFPIIFHSPGIPTPDNLDTLREMNGVQLSLREAAVAMKALTRYGRFRAGFEAGIAASAPISPDNDAAHILVPPHGGATDRGQVRKTLADYGIPTPPELVAYDTETAVAAATEMGFPVAMKIESTDVPHKTDAGCVVLGVDSAEQAAEAYERIIANARKAVPAARLDGVLVQKMMPPGVEMVVGMTRDPDFGPMITLGLGGILVEVLRDSVTVPAPISRADAFDMIERLKGAAILKGARGSPPSDMGALADVLVGLSNLVAATGGLLDEVDLNPVIVYPEGEGAAVVDYLFVHGAAAPAAVADAA